MIALFDATLPSDQLTQVTAALDSVGIEYTESGGKIMVPAEKRLAAWSQTSYVGALPQNSQSAFDKMLESVNPWDSTGVLKERFNRAREVTLSQMMTQWKGVSKADVVIDSREKIGVIQKIEPSATVSILTRNSGGNPRKLAETAADTVSGAIAGMKRSNVQVVVDGMSYLIRDRDEGMGGNDIIDMLRSHEERVEEKILAHFSYIRGLTVGVTAELNTKTIQTRAREANKAGSLSLPRNEVSETVENSSKPGATEPGALPNIGIGESGMAGGGSSLEERVDTQFDNEIGVTETTTRDPAGNAKIVGASLRVPRSYFVQVWKQRHPDEKEPSEDDLAKNMKFEFDAMKADVKNLTGIDADELVSIQDYTELDAAFAPAGSIGSVAPSPGMTSFATSYIREIGVGLLAIVSLFMVARLVKKSSPTPAQRSASSSSTRSSISSMSAAESVAGVAPEGLSMLTATELDIDSLESRQMMDQVTTLVKEDPEMAANLLRKWLKP
ncbi:MAG TPA: hypothetical protein PK402_11195, partial [Tepidisphaeraceae bacterium]|nr:hypothetical protein [Tepidisphaeraceae bacterium]